MQDVSKGEGRTVLFVSHNMVSVKNLCNKAILLQNGQLVDHGIADNIVDNYILNSSYKSDFNYENQNNDFHFKKLLIQPAEQKIICISSGINFKMDFDLKKEQTNLAVTIEVSNINDVVVFHHGHWIFENNDSKSGSYSLTINLPPNTLNSGMYKISLIFAENYHDIFFKENDIEFFEVENEILAKNARILPGVLRPSLSYEIKMNN
jgi:lipopolysaccharide transport system ATP-binding protein